MTDQMPGNSTSMTDIDESGRMMLLYYASLYKVISIISATTILILGLVGNISVTTIIIFARDMRTSTNCYLASVAIADIMVLLSTIIPFLSQINQVIELWVLPYFFCSFLIYINFLSVNSSALTIACFSFERYVAICNPLKAHTICTVSRALKITVGIWIFNLIYNSNWIFLTGIIEIPVSNSSIKPICTYVLKRHHYKVIYMVDFILFYCIPLFMTCIFYCAIIKVVVTRPMASMTSRGDSSTKNGMSSKIQMVKMLMVVVILFAILWLPYRAWMVYNSFASKIYLDLWYSLFAKTMVFINSAVNPILYNAMSAKFRKAFKKFFLCRPRL